MKETLILTQVYLIQIIRSLRMSNPAFKTIYSTGLFKKSKSKRISTLGKKRTLIGSSDI